MRTGMLNFRLKQPMAGTIAASPMRRKLAISLKLITQSRPQAANVARAVAAVAAADVGAAVGPRTVWSDRSQMN